MPLTLPRRCLALLCALVPALAARADGPRDGQLFPSVDFEGGLVAASRNDVRIPGDGGTRFSLTEGAFRSEASVYFRAQLGLAYGRHHLLATAAPLRLRSSGRGDDSLDFAGRRFTSGGTTARYQFDTYRLTYRYALWRGPRTELQGGATLLVRDAEIRLTQDGSSARKRNVGVVPLLSLRASWRFAGPLALVLDGDALAAPQGRAEDALLALQLDTGDVLFRIGYRVIEGGADNASVYAFALLHHVAAGVTYTF